jgi:hypothetical protein
MGRVLLQIVPFAHLYPTRIPFENLCVNRCHEHTGLQSGILLELFCDQMCGEETTRSPPVYAITGNTLAGMPSLKAIPIVVRITYDDGITQIFKYLTKDNPALSHIRTFPIVSNDCSKPLIIGGMREILARAIHDQYRALRSGQNQSPTDDPAMKPWPELDEDLKESNRKQADHIPIKLQKVNCGLEVLTN